MGTPNLAIAHIAAAQNQPEVTANGAFDALDNAENALVSFANGDADMTLTQAQLASGGAIKITGALTADRHINLPASIDRSFIFENSTTGGHNLIVQVTGAPGSTVTLAASASLVQMFSDGANVTQLTGGSGGIFNFADEEVPSGTINGSNATFTLAHTPNPAGSLKLFKNGLRLKAGGVDYTLATATITYVTAPASGDTHVADYRY